MKKIRIYKGKTKPGRSFVGTQARPDNIQDKFGDLWVGDIRSCYINTRWGQLSVPFSWIGKRIEINVKELKYQDQKQ